MDVVAARGREPENARAVTGVRTRTRVLVVAEAVTLAHVTRPLALAQALDPARWDVHFACADDDLMRGKDFVFAGCGFTRWSIGSMPSARFLRATASGARLYDYRTLSAYVDDDLRLIERVRPEVIVGDLRLSLATSARMARVPYAAITNAYWSPALPLERFPVPDYAAFGCGLRRVGNRVARWGLPLGLRWHARPLNRVRRSRGLSAPGEFRAAYTDADLVLYADHPALVPLPSPPAHHRFLGPVLWSPPVPPPPWWDALPASRTAVYVTMGSSGRAGALPQVLAELRGLDASLLVAAKDLPDAPHDRVYAAEFLPGEAAARRSRLVVCNGGSGSVYQALAHGVPVLGIAANMDQLLLMGHVERAGCGLVLRAGQLAPGRIAAAARALIDDPRFAAAAQRLARELRSCDARQRFREQLAGLISDTTSGTAVPALPDPHHLAAATA